jgi:hypothetical protein
MLPTAKLASKMLLPSRGSNATCHMKQQQQQQYQQQCSGQARVIENPTAKLASTMLLPLRGSNATYHNHEKQQQQQQQQQYKAKCHEEMNRIL